MRQCRTPPRNRKWPTESKICVALRGTLHDSSGVDLQATGRRLPIMATRRAHETFTANTTTPATTSILEGLAHAVKCKKYHNPPQVPTGRPRSAAPAQSCDRPAASCIQKPSLGISSNSSRSTAHGNRARRFYLPEDSCQSELSFAVRPRRLCSCSACSTCSSTV